MEGTVTNRIDSIDAIRGFALLGLPLMNIISFAMPFSAYMNPTVVDNDSVINHIIFSFLNVVADQKFMGLFTLLFGVSIVLLRQKNLQNSRKAAWIHYSRMIWLFVFGILHVWFLWEGDVLVVYAFIGFIIYPFILLPNKALLSVAIVVLGFSFYILSCQDIKSENIGKNVRAELVSIYKPSEQQIIEQSARYLGSYADVVSHNRAGLIGETDTVQTKVDVILGNWLFAIILKSFGLMCVGVVLFRYGVVQAALSPKIYKKILLGGIVIGLPITLFGLIWNYSANWNIDHYYSLGMVSKEVGAVFLTIAYIGILIIALKRVSFGKYAVWLGSVGRMALTNYILQSGICAFIFYGYGLGLHGTMSRLQLLPIVVVIWVFQIGFSIVWLHYFSQGPLEWVWRCLTYLRPQPLLKRG